MAIETDERLTPAEDAELRRLHWFERLGCQLSDALGTIKESIRSRDRRADIREPDAGLGTYPAGEPTAALPRPSAPLDKRTTVEQEGGYWVRVRRD